MSDRFRPGRIQGVVVRPLPAVTDERGWLTEIFRHDELEREFFPVMSYISSTVPGVTRGPHEHLDQADFFCFIGPSTFKLRMWDNRRNSQTFNAMSTLFVGEDNPTTVLIPSGVVHAYQNVGNNEGIVINCPNRLYRGDGRKGPVDEIRHEDDAQTAFRMDD